MKRLTLIALAIAFVLSFGGGDARARLGGGDDAKLRKLFVVLLDRFADDKAKERAQEGFADFFGKKPRLKILKEVEDLGALMATCTARDRQTPNKVQEKVLELKDLIKDSPLKLRCAVSTPKTYQWSQKAPAWPLILCMPPDGETAMQYLDKNWKSSAVREQYVIAVLGFDYEDIKVTVRKEVNENGKVALQNVTEKRPFTWDTTEALQKFWGGFVLLVQREFKIDPNRVILDGAGMGSTGALSYAVDSTWRFSGIVLRDGELTTPALANLANLPVLVMPTPGAGEGAKKTIETVKAIEGAQTTEAGVDGATGALAPAWDGGSEEQGAELRKWLDTCVRNRYPLPCRWVRQASSQQVGYWCSVNGLFDDQKHAEIKIDCDRKRKRINVETANVSKFSIFLNDVIVDMDKPFEVYVNGEKLWEGNKTRSPEYLLDHAMVRMPADPGAVFTNKIEKIDIAPPPEPEKDEDKEGEGEKDGDKEGGGEKDGEKDGGGDK